jgi:hypothetical protein
MMRPIVLAALLACASTGAAAQTMYKCSQEGKTVYQQEPCAEAAKQETLKAQKGPAASGTDAASQGAVKASTSPAAAGGGSDADGVIEVLAGYRACSDAISEWDPTHRAAFDSWKSRNAATVARVEQAPDLQRKYNERLQRARGGSVRGCVQVLDVIKPDRDKSSITKKLSQ